MDGYVAYEVAAVRGSGLYDDNTAFFEERDNDPPAYLPRLAQWAGAPSRGRWGCARILMQIRREQKCAGLKMPCQIRYAPHPDEKMEARYQTTRGILICLRLIRSGMPDLTEAGLVRMAQRKLEKWKTGAKAS